jgi:hypothetical protein
MYYLSKHILQTLNDSEFVVCLALWEHTARTSYAYKLKFLTNPGPVLFENYWPIEKLKPNILHKSRDVNELIALAAVEAL